MHRSFVRILALVGIAGLSACQGAGVTGNTIPSGSALAQPLAAAGMADGEIPVLSPNAARPLCPEVVPGQARCHAILRTDLRAATAGPGSGGYGPADLQSAYKISGGSGSKVAIVDAYGYPSASADLAVYRSYYHLPACTTANGCLTIRNQTGGTNPPPSNPSWDGEQALDLDMVSAMCPQCKIVLVQANSAYLSDLYSAVREAASLGGVVISNSYGASEYAQCSGGGEKSDPAFSVPGHTYVASAGDQGGGLKNCGGPAQPCSLATVICVGGTRLVHAHNPRGWDEQSWNTLSSCGTGVCGATNSGCSTIVPKPAWQNDAGCKMRSETDVSADASPATPVVIYVQGFWFGAGGTSVSAPIIAGLIGRAGNGASGYGPKALWANRAKLYAQTVGSNIYTSVSGPCASSVHYICYAGKGYNGPMGLGTPNGLGAF